LNPDPDTDPVPAFKANPGLDPGFDDQKKSQQKNFFFILFDQKLQLLIPGLHKEGPSYRRSLQPSKENIQHLKR
jgi:hypothetical protein